MSRYLTFVLAFVFHVQFSFAEDSLIHPPFLSEEVESLRQAFPDMNTIGLSDIQNMKNFLHCSEYLSFERLLGGYANAPILIYKGIDLDKVPFAVLKRALNPKLDEIRMQLINEIRKNGNCHLPNIFNDGEGYLVKLGSDSFYCMEYLKPDSDAPLILTFEQMLELTSNFHQASSDLWEKSLLSNVLTGYSAYYSTSLAPELEEWRLSIEPAIWDACVKCAHYFTTSTFHSIYDQLPKRILHGDIHRYNVISSEGNLFLIDFDRLRIDARLLDFTVFSGGSFLQEYLKHTQDGDLFSLIKSHYGPLDPIEEEIFHFIVLFERCEGLEWALGEFKEAIRAEDTEKIDRFTRFLRDITFCIYGIYSGIPQVKAVIDQSLYTGST